ncbi:hypothetical protein Tco_1043989 [Tanacetum coccineum]|uniref:Uncharacterized protein n=1 Tax=Tanacetum coccineum TaxID=301880 RepID=A0ABQ5GPN0_9ASTR
MSGKYGTSNAGAESVGVSDCNKVYKEAGNEVVMSISDSTMVLNLDGMERSELTLFSLDVSQVFNFFLQIGLTLIFATLEDLDLGLLGDVISEDDCGDDGEDENVFIIGERCNLGWMNIVKITSPRDV